MFHSVTSLAFSKVTYSANANADIQSQCNVWVQEVPTRLKTYHLLYDKPKNHILNVKCVWVPWRGSVCLSFTEGASSMSHLKQVETPMLNELRGETEHRGPSCERENKSSEDRECERSPRRECPLRLLPAQQRFHSCFQRSKWNALTIWPSLMCFQKRIWDFGPYYIAYQHSQEWPALQKATAKTLIIFRPLPEPLLSGYFCGGVNDSAAIRLLTYHPISHARVALDYNYLPWLPSGSHSEESRLVSRNNGCFCALPFYLFPPMQPFI